MTKPKLKYANILTKSTLTKLYSELKTITAISKKLNIADSTISKYLNLYKIPYNKTTKNLFRFAVDDYMFATDTEQSMYIAGFIAADGCISKDPRASNKANNKLLITIKDKHHIYLIKRLLKTDTKITPTKTGLYQLQLTSNQICDDLTNRFNITPRKSLTLQFPERLLDNDLAHHFIRGFLDGDGTFCKKSKGKGIRISFIGTKNMLTSIKRIFARLNLLSDPKITRGSGRNHKTFSLQYGCQVDIAKIVHYLYDDATLFLKRKHNIAMTIEAPQKYSSIDGRPVKWSDDEVRVVHKMNKKGISKQEIAQKMKMPYNTVRALLNPNSKRKVK